MWVASRQVRSASCASLLKRQIREDDDLFTGEHLKVFQNLKKLMRKKTHRAGDVTSLHKVVRYTIKYPRHDIPCPWAGLTQIPCLATLTLLDVKREHQAFQESHCGVASF